jgi:AraC family transcriptional activator of mtrCDE
MDTLSRLLSLYSVSTALTVRCRFGAPWILDHPQQETGVAPYHLIISGTAMLDGGPPGGRLLQAGDVVVFPKGYGHRLHMTEQGEPSLPRELAGEHVLRLMGNDGTGAATEILCGEFRFDARASVTLLRSLPEVMVVSSEGRADLNGFQHLLAMLRLETDAVRPGSALVVSHLASALFALVMRAWLEQPSPSPGLFGLLAERRLQAAVDGMLAAPEQPWTLERMAAVCNMSRATFVRVFVRTAGAAPGVVLAHMRMARAAQFLAEGTLPVAAIGEAVGYQSEAAFNRVFKRSYGIGPGQYRRQERMLVPAGAPASPAGGP